TQTDFERSQREHVDHFVRLDGPRHAPAKTRGGGFTEPAEGGHDANLAFLDDVEAAAEPDHERRSQHGEHAEARATRIGPEPTATAAIVATAAAAPTEQSVQAAVEIAPQFIEIRRTFFAGPLLVAWIVLAVAGAATAPPLRIIERHDGFLRGDHGKRED